MFAAYIILEEQGYFEAPIEAKGDLVLSFGSFKATETGVNATLKPPLEQLSGHQPWDRVPVGLGLLKLFFAGEGSAVDRFATMFLTDEQKDNLELLFEQNRAAWMAEASELMKWGANLSFRCPHGSVAHDLQRLPALMDADLDDFVRSQFPLR